jgi:hypothetical protein
MLLKHGQEVKVEGIYRILLTCLYDNVQVLGPDLDSTTSVQSEY